MAKFIQYVAYPGIVRRGILKSEFKAMGIDHPDVWFDNSNHNQVNADEFPPEVMAVFEADDDFKVVDYDAKDDGDQPKGPKSMTGLPYPEEERKAAAEKAAGDAPGGEGTIGDSTAPTPTTSASSRAGGTSGGTRGSSR